MSADSDGLAERLLHHDEDVLGDILIFCGPAIRAHLVRKYAGLLRPGEVDDILLAALQRTWRKRRKLDLGGGRLTRWLFHVCEGLAVDLLRSQWVRERRREKEVAPEQLARLPDRPSPETEGTREESSIREVIELLREALDALPEKQRRILTADADSPEGLASAAELADTLGISHATVRVYRHRALERLRRELRQRGFSEERHGDG